MNDRMGMEAHGWTMLITVGVLLPASMKPDGDLSSMRVARASVHALLQVIAVTLLLTGVALGTSSAPFRLDHGARSGRVRTRAGRDPSRAHHERDGELLHQGRRTQDDGGGFSTRAFSPTRWWGRPC